MGLSVVPGLPKISPTPWAIRLSMKTCLPLMRRISSPGDSSTKVERVPGSDRRLLTTMLDSRPGWTVTADQLSSSRDEETTSHDRAARHLPGAAVRWARGLRPPPRGARGGLLLRLHGSRISGRRERGRGRRSHGGAAPRGADGGRTGHLHGDTIPARWTRCWILRREGAAPQALAGG